MAQTASGKSVFPNGITIVADGDKVCPACEERKPLKDFGYRHMGKGVYRPQSYCSPCRSRSKGAKR